MIIENIFSVTAIYMENIFSGSDTVTEEIYTTVVYLDNYFNSGGGSGGSVAWVDITGKPTTFAPSAHTHVTGDVPGLTDFQLTSGMSNYQTTGNYLTIQTVQTQGTFNTTQLNDYQLTANNSLSLGTEYTTHTHNYQSTGNYLTTAMLSNASTQFIQANANFNGTNISGTIASNGISLSVAPGGGGADGFNIIAAGGSTANSTGTIVFSNSNGVSFGLNGGTVTATVKTDYLTTAQPVGAYLTTAMLSNAATISNIRLSAGTTSNLLSAFTMSNGNGVSFGLNGSVITASVAAAGGAQTGVSGISAGTTLMTSGTLSIANSNGVSFGMNGNTLTATVATNYQSQGAYLTTAALSNHSHAFATTTTNGASIIVGTSNSAGVTIGVPAYLTTAQAPGAYLTTARASNDAIGLNTALTANGVSVTANSSGLSLNFPAFLTTGALSNHSHNFATTTTNGALIVVATTNSAGATIAVPSFLTTAQAPGAYLTTAMLSNASTAFAGTGSAITNGTMTYGTGGLSLNLSNHLTTAMASNAGSNFVQAGAAFAGTNASGTIASNGISISVAAPGGGGAINVSAGTTSGNLQTIQFDNANNLSFGLNGSTVTGSFNPVNIGMSTNGNTAGTTGTFDGGGLQYIFAGGANITLSQSSNANSVTLSIVGGAGGGGATLQGFNPFMYNGESVPSNAGNNTMYFAPFQAPAAFQFDQVALALSYSNASNSSNSVTGSFSIGIFSRNNSSLSLITSASVSIGITNSGTVGSYSLYSGYRQLYVNLTTTLPAGNYWAGILSRTSANAAGMSLQQVAVSQVNQPNHGILGSSVNGTKGPYLGMGIYTASFSTGMPNSFAFSHIQGTASIVQKPPMFWFTSNEI